jgi:hypothetical protein
VVDPLADRDRRVFQMMILTIVQQDPGEVSVAIGGELGKKLGTILKTPLKVRGHLGDANSR